MKRPVVVLAAALVAAFSCPVNAEQLYCRIGGSCIPWPPPFGVGLTCPPEDISTVPCPKPTPTPTPPPTPTPTPVPPQGAAAPVSFDPGMALPCFEWAPVMTGVMLPVDVPQAADCSAGRWLVAGSRQWGPPGSNMVDLLPNRDGHMDFYWNRLASGGIITTIGLHEDGVAPAPWTWAYVGGWQPIPLTSDLWLEATIYYGDSRWQLPGGDRVLIQLGVWDGDTTYDLEVVTAHHNLWFGPWANSAWICSDLGLFSGIGLDYYCVLFGDDIGWATPFNRTTTIYIPVSALHREASERYPNFFPEPSGGWGSATLVQFGVSVEVHGSVWAFVNVSNLTLWRGDPRLSGSRIIRRHINAPHEPAPLVPRRVE